MENLLINNYVKDDDKVDNDSIEQFLKSVAKHKSQKKYVNKDISRFSAEINSRLEEFASPFLLIGYDVNGGYFQLSNFKSQKDYDSLIVALDRCKSYGFKGDIDPKDLELED
jgi:tRNA G26 N,N-dimethylase Trm1